MFNNILNLEGVTTMNKTAQQSIQGGEDDHQTAGDVQAYLDCLRNGGNWCHPNMH